MQPPDRYSQPCSSWSVATVPVPDWWNYPRTCPAGHAWGPGRVLVGWTPCNCPPALAAQPKGAGHLTVRCDSPGCTARWYKPRHESGADSLARFGRSSSAPPATNRHRPWRLSCPAFVVARYRAERGRRYCDSLARPAAFSLTARAGRLPDGAFQEVIAGPADELPVLHYCQYAGPVLAPAAYAAEGHRPRSHLVQPHRPCRLDLRGPAGPLHHPVRIHRLASSVMARYALSRRKEHPRRRPTRPSGVPRLGGRRAGYVLESSRKSRASGTEW